VRLGVSDGIFELTFRLQCRVVSSKSGSRLSGFVAVCYRGAVSWESFRKLKIAVTRVWRGEGFLGRWVQVVVESVDELIPQGIV
jgi:hypothetical protein